MGVRVGSIDKIEPLGDRTRVTFHYSNSYPVPANATASILNPSLVASRNIQLAPAYESGPVLKDGAVIPIERTQVPVEWDRLRDSINGILRQLGPTPEHPTGPFGEVIESAADNLAGKGKQINEALNSLSDALTALNEGRGDFVVITRQPGAIHQRAVPQRSTVRRAERQPRPVHRLVHQIRSRRGRHHHTRRRRAGDRPKVLQRQRIRARPRRQEPRRSDHHDPATRTSRRPGNRVTCAAHLRRQLQQPLLPGARLARGPDRVPQLRQPNSIHLQRYSGRQPTGLPRLRRAVRAVSGTGSRRHQVQLPSVRGEPLRLGGRPAQGGGLLRGPAAPAARVQGHYRPGHLLAGYTALVRQSRTGLGGRARNAGHEGSAGDGRHADTGIVGRAHGRP